MTNQRRCSYRKLVSTRYVVINIGIGVYLNVTTVFFNNYYFCVAIVESIDFTFLSVLKKLRIPDEPNIVIFASPALRYKFTAELILSCQRVFVSLDHVPVPSSCRDNDKSNSNYSRVYLFIMLGHLLGEETVTYIHQLITGCSINTSTWELTK